MKENKLIPGIQRLAEDERVVREYVRLVPKLDPSENHVPSITYYPKRLREILNDDDVERSKELERHPKKVTWSWREAGRWRVVSLIDPALIFLNPHGTVLGVSAGSLLKFSCQPKDRLSKSERNFKRFLAKKAQPLSNK